MRKFLEKLAAGFLFALLCLLAQQSGTVIGVLLGEKIECRKGHPQHGVSISCDISKVSPWNVFGKDFFERTAT